jgi:hypothetical protein
MEQAGFGVAAVPSDSLLNGTNPVF